MAHILFAKPDPYDPVVGIKGEIPVHSGSLRECIEKAEFWRKQGESCRIVNQKGEDRTPKSWVDSGWTNPR